MRTKSFQASGLELVLTRSATDAEFRRRLLVDPRGAIFDEFGVEMPPGFRARFVEKEPGLDLMVVLPDLVDDLEDDVSDVMGGVGWEWLTHPGD